MSLSAAVIFLLSLAPACQAAADGMVAAPTGYSSRQPPPARQATKTTEDEIVGAGQRRITAADNVRFEFFCTCLATIVALVFMLVDTCLTLCTKSESHIASLSHASVPSRAFCICTFFCSSASTPCSNALRIQRHHPFVDNVCTGTLIHPELGEAPKQQQTCRPGQE